MMWKVVVAILLGGIVLAVVLMSDTVKDKVDMATNNAKKTVKKIQSAVTKSSSVSASKADLDKQGIRIEGTHASAAIAENERADSINAYADIIKKADAAKKAAQLEAAKKLIAEEDAAVAAAAVATKATYMAAQKTLEEERAALKAELRALDLQKSGTELFESDVQEFVGFEHAACV